MNAPATPAAVAEPTLAFIPIAKLCESPTHIQALRRARFDKKALGELAASIRKVGVLQAIVARPQYKVRVTKSDVGDLWYPEILNIAGHWNQQAACRSEAEAEQAAAKLRIDCEIVAGERRWLAARIAGLTTVPVSVRELTDEQVLEIQLIENLQREGLHELEEAEGYEELMQLKKINAEAVADMVGKSRSYVYARTKLLALCPEARKAFYAGELDASRALLVARIGHHDTQRQAMKDLVQGPVRYGDRREGGPLSYRAAHKHILQTYMLALKSAPFDLKNATLLPKAGTCTACPKRTGNQPGLFSDVKDADVCTDPKCFDDKRQAHFAGARTALEAKGRKVIAGDAAKKILTGWNSPNKWAQDRMEGGYVKLTDTTYAAGKSRQVGELLGEAYEPLLIQHPGTGAIVRVATQQAVTAAAAAKQRGRSKATGVRGSRPAEKTGPSPDDVAARAHAQLDKQLQLKQIGRPELVMLAEELRDGWSETDLTFALLKCSVHTKLDKYSDRDLIRLILLGAFENGLLDLIQYGGHSPIVDALCKRFKVDLKKIEQDLKSEFSRKAAEEKAKLAKAPVAKVKATIQKRATKAKGKKK